MFIITIRFCHILPFHGFSANFQKLLRILLPIGSTVCSDTSLQAFLSAAASASPAAFCARLIDSHQNITGQLRHGFSAHHRKLPDNADSAFMPFMLHSLCFTPYASPLTQGSEYFFKTDPVLCGNLHFIRQSNCPSDKIRGFLHRILQLYSVDGVCCNH